MLKKVISLVLSLVVIFTLGVSVGAIRIGNEISPNYLYTGDVTCQLKISGGTASCCSNLTGSKSVTKIIGSQYLEKKNSDGDWEKVVLTDITPDMEYKLSTDSEWSEIIGNQLVFDVPDYGMTYYIRYKSTSESFSSSYKSLTLLNRRTAPSCIYDQSTQTITKLSNSMEIKIGEVGSYTPVTSTTYDLSDVFLSTDFVTIYIRYKATNTQPASYIQVIPCNVMLML